MIWSSKKWKQNIELYQISRTYSEISKNIKLKLFIVISVIIFLPRMLHYIYLTLKQVKQHVKRINKLLSQWKTANLKLGGKKDPTDTSREVYNKFAWSSDWWETYSEWYMLEIGNSFNDIKSVSKLIIWRCLNHELGFSDIKLLKVEPKMRKRKIL